MNGNNVPDETVFILSIGNDISEQAVKTQIRSRRMRRQQVVNGLVEILGQIWEGIPVFRRCFRRNCRLLLHSNRMLELPRWGSF